MELLERKFAALGARAKINAGNAGRGRNQMNGNVRLNVLEDSKGEFFDIRINSADVEVSVLDIQPADRHLLLMAKAGNVKSKFLMGHDERHWFVAAIPETAPVGTVRQAKEALKPLAIQDKQVGLNAKQKNKRKNSAYCRQGEWFFTSANIPEPDPVLILKNEPITRGNGSKPHMCEFVYRSRGTAVMVCGRYPNGVSLMEYRRLLDTDKNAKSWGWRSMMKDAIVYVKGKIRHPDHKTIVLSDWCRVYQNNENQAKAMNHVAFLD